jgi:hypothetical protein
MLRISMTPLRTLAVLAFLAPFTTGCFGRTAPFNSLDKAPITVMRLQGQEAPQAAAQAQLPQIPGLPIPPEFQQQMQQAVQGLAQMLPPGLIPPGLIPGAPMGQQNTANLPRFKNFVILAQMPMTDDDARDELLDIFGHESSFSADKGQCFTPGMGISIARGGSEPPVDLLISISCNQAMGDGFKWPYEKNGLTPETKTRLTHMYEKLWGPVPPGA